MAEVSSPLRAVRVFAPAGASAREGDELTLNAEESQYLVRVRRCRAGDRLTLFTDDGTAHEVEVQNPDRRSATLRIGRELTQPPTPSQLHLCVGLPDPAPLLQILTDATELGATRITLLDTARSEGRRPSEARLSNTLRAAQRQSARSRAPEIAGPLKLAALLDEFEREQTRFVFGDVEQTKTQTPLNAIDGLRGHTAAIVGPPGGFTAEEHQQLRRAGGLGLSLSPWVLRTETAATALLAAVALTAT